MNISPSQNMTDVISRCPSCSARVELSDAACGQCGQTLTSGTVLRSASGTAAASSGARRAFASSHNAENDSDVVAKAGSSIPADPSAATGAQTGLQSQSRADILNATQTASVVSPAVSPIESHDRFEQPVPIAARVEDRAATRAATLGEAAFVQPPLFVPTARKPTARNTNIASSTMPSGAPLVALPSNLMSRYSVPLMLGGAVVVLTAALVIGVNLARQTTPDMAAAALGARNLLSATPASVAPSEITLSGSIDASQSTVVAQSTHVASARATLAVSATAMAQTAVQSQAASSATPQVESAAGAPAAGQPLNKWQLELASARYETAGRPAQSCSAFNADQPIRKFTFTLRVTNNTGIDLDARRWGAAAYVGAAPAEQLCYFKTEGPTLPTLLQGQPQQVTLAAFIEPGQNISQIVIGDNEGNAAYLCLNDTEVVECKTTP